MANLANFTKANYEDQQTLKWHNHPKFSVGNAPTAWLMLLIYPRMNARRIFYEISRAIGMDSQLSDAPSGAAQHDLLIS